MASGVRLRMQDKGAEALLKRMQGAAKAKGVSVGVFEQEAPREEGEVTNVDVAAFAEFGTVTTEARPWCTAWFDEEEAANRKALQQIGHAVLKGVIPSADVGLDRFGLLARGSMQRRIRGHIPPPNAQSTIDQKGSSTPLIASAQFWGSITHRLER